MPKFSQLTAMVSQAVDDIMAWSKNAAGGSFYETRQQLADWIVKTAASFTQSGSGSVATDLQTRGRWSVYLTDKMTAAQIADVTGNTGALDLSAAIQAAIDDLPTNGGEIIAIPGTYNFASKINFNKTVHLRCLGGPAASGATAAVVFQKASTLNDTGFLITGLCCELEGFQMVGVSGNGGDGIVINGGRCTLRKVTVKGMGNDGIRIGTNAGDTNQNGWALYDVISRDNGNFGVYIDDDSDGGWAASSPNANAGTAINLEVLSNTSDGLKIDIQGANTFVGTLAQGNGGYGVHVASGSQWACFIGGDINEANTSGDFILDARAASGAGHTMIYGTDMGVYTDNGYNTIILTEKATQLTSIGTALIRIGATANSVTDTFGVNNSAVGTILPILLGAVTGALGSNQSIQYGTGSPEGVKTAGPGSLFIRSNGTDHGLTTYEKVSGTGNTGWRALGWPSVAATQISAKASTINTSDKYQGRIVYDTTNHRLMVADGSADVSVWYIADGSGSVTPA